LIRSSDRLTELGKYSASRRRLGIGSTADLAVAIRLYGGCNNLVAGINQCLWIVLANIGLRP
jgi:hypothetical protein